MACLKNCGIPLGYPTVADDMVQVSLSRVGLSNMLDVCDAYSRRWRYLYNTNKCEMVVFNDTIPKHLPFMLGDEPVKESDRYCQEETSGMQQPSSKVLILRYAIVAFIRVTSAR